MKKVLAMILVTACIASIGCVACADNMYGEYADILVCLNKEVDEINKEEGKEIYSAVNGVIEDDETITVWFRVNGAFIELPEYEIIVIAYDCRYYESDVCAYGDIKCFVDTDAGRLDITDEVLF